MGNFAERISHYIELGYIRKKSILTVNRFICRSIKGKVCITLCNVIVHKHKTNSIIGSPEPMQSNINKCHICKHIKLSWVKFKTTGCCEQDVCNVCIFRSMKIHKCSICGFMKCSSCSFVKFYRCGSCDNISERAHEFCGDCWMRIFVNKKFRCKGCDKYPSITQTKLILH